MIECMHCWNMRVHFTRHGELVTESFNIPSSGRNDKECLLPLKERLSVSGELLELCKNQRELTVLRSVEKCAETIDSLTQQAVSVNAEEGVLEQHLTELKKQFDQLQQQKQMLLFFSETNLTTADELATVSVS